MPTATNDRPIPLEQRLWGKAGLGASDDAVMASDWHPLLCHMLDVAAVAELLLERLPPSLQRRLDRSLPRRWLVFLVALHDLGKATPTFQCKWEPCLSHLKAAGFRFERVVRLQPHGTTGAGLIVRVLEDRGCAPQQADAWARAVAAHHGSFPSDAEVHRASTRRQLGADAWEEVRARLVSRLAAMLEVDDPPSAMPTHADVILLAGLTCVADWLGSNADVFLYQPVPFDPDAYWGRARRLAADALGRVHLAPPPRVRQRSFVELFGNEPWPLHEAVAELMPTLTDAPTLLVIESPMGEGKTEAALFASERFAAQHGSAGLFVGLPTQATANQMLHRVRRFLEEAHAEHQSELHLVHGNAALSDAYRDLRLRSVSETGHGRHAVAATEWFSRKKRALLGSHAVGTVDQALLGVLHTRHAFVRLFGLAGKTVVLDEVHAYDTYTSDLLDALVAWLGALGANVIVLSATLPQVRRKALVEAFRGASFEDDTAYPRITWATPKSAGAVATAPRNRGRSVAICPFPPEVDAVATQLWERVRDGGTAAWICNTVGRAQNAFRALEARRPDGADLDMLHARFANRQRSEREERICRRYGPGDNGRPSHGVVVGTQVLEQSLDLDFDFMVTDIAPVDLVIQRMGRLHRHHRPGRPGHLATATLGLCQPPRDVAHPSFAELAGVYDEAIMLRSWLALGRSSMGLPDDLEPLIEQVYGAEPPPVPEHLRERLAAAAREHERLRDDHMRQAHLQKLGLPRESRDIFAVSAFELDDEDPTTHPALRAMTRLGDPSVDVVCLQADDGGAPRLPNGERLDLRRAPSRRHARALVEMALRVSSRGLVPQIVAMPAPPGWTRSPFLRHHRLLVFESGVAIVGSYRLVLDPSLGLIIERSANPP